MKIYTCNSFKGHWPVGTSAVILAEDKFEAKRLLFQELAKIHLEQDLSVDQIDEVAMEKGATILQDGEY